MPDSPRSDHRLATDAASDTDRAAKVEQLLLIGLDHYFASQYEQAINVWTRALFFDRHHARARAYIERARSALAERQRESEELLGNGVAAFERGEGSEARRLLEAAIEAGGPTEEALVVLERLNRLEASVADQQPTRATRVRRPATTEVSEPQSRRTGLVWTAVVVSAVSVVFGAMIAADPTGWRARIGLPPAVGSGSLPVTASPDLPLPRRSQLALERARALAAAGHLADALTTLEAVRPTDPERVDADRLRSDIQHQLLALTATPAPAEAASGDQAGQ